MIPTPDKILTFIDDVFFTDEDAEAKAIIVALGMLNHINTHHLSPKRKAEFAMSGTHSTHWLLIGRFGGFQRKEDNGYCVAGWPKRKYSELEFKSLAATLCAQVLGSPKDAEFRMIDTKSSSS
ncbi:MAG: hypothetical protein HZA31_04330 [Opitutae bacterium]|nr:hypothetical protein [Opitutae bacterium]